MKIKKISAVLLTSVLFLAPAGLKAQKPIEDDSYKTMLEEAMKSGKYSLSQVDNWDARVKKISGSVSVKTADSEEWSRLEGEMPLEASDFVKTGGDGSAEIYLDDKGSIFLGGNTQLEISAIVKTETAFSLKSGFLAAKIRHFLNEKFKMQVRVPSAVCAVRGTEFAVQYSPFGKETGAAVFDEGSLLVTPMDEKGQTLGEYFLEKNTELTFTPDQRRLKTVPLAKMRRYTTQIALMRLRLKALKKAWKPLSQSRRADLRNKVLKHVIRKELNDGSGPKKSKFKSKVKNKAKRGGSGRAPKKTGARRVRPVAEEEEEE
ncbi:MAG: FecR domain-containing protein [Elusimicrobia bacterium]|nr:FecR domain-containing protein [Elusimicrobiota bacterium]